MEFYDPKIIFKYFNTKPPKKSINMLNLILGAVITAVVGYLLYKKQAQKEQYSYSFGFPTWGSVNNRVQFIPRPWHRHFRRWSPYHRRHIIYDTGLMDCYLPPIEGDCVSGFGRIGRKCCNMDQFT